ncbi:glutathione binding-like protein [Granulosicoccus antarcticus]|uniref:GST C-terminal domain-containing protein n=1 Tax=Granulosicoccus antarcticus IMCC3135 TaxID=1192854 RepID=A0A2Z2P1E1_9GAMM|nr:glutathione binding-like protein [Granulosicoccus antarcticus]ASJ76615.1 hypothetical protein IMCC3135_32850 [Granulosicoccus antarcticus IMCC3135]
MNHTEAAPTIPRVITFPPSADSETGRWALDYYDIKVDERRHAPPFIFAAIGLNKGKKFPLFMHDELMLNGVEQILDHFNERALDNRQLTPDEHRDEIEAHWKRFNATMGAAVVTWAYTHLLPHRSIMIRPLSLGSPWYQQQFVRFLYPIPKTMLWNALKLSRPKADEALKTIEATFAYVDELLADNRRWLVGDRMTLADLSFAVSGAPLVLPEGYGGYPGDQGPIPSLEQWPAEQRAIIKAMRQTRAGQFILRMYKEERYRHLNLSTGAPVVQHSTSTKDERVIDIVE